MPSKVRIAVRIARNIWRGSEAKLVLKREAEKYDLWPKTSPPRTPDQWMTFANNLGRTLGFRNFAFLAWREPRWCSQRSSRYIRFLTTGVLPQPPLPRAQPLPRTLEERIFSPIDR